MFEQITINKHSSRVKWLSVFIDVVGSKHRQTNFHHTGNPNAWWCCALPTILPTEAAAWPTDAAVRLWSCSQGRCARKQEW